MCGIAGLVTVEPGAASAAHRVQLMQQELAHRGPDGAATWTSTGRHATFATTRLAIIAPSGPAVQPLSIDNGRLTVTFNGEIYNFIELRRELELRGTVFQTPGDAEVLLRAFDAYGESCVERLRGMFAFAIWDDRNRRLTLARDRFGIKPLYYAVQHDRVVFASEIRALTASALISPAIDTRAAYEYFRTGSVPEPRTMLAGAKSVESGHTLTWQHGRVAHRRYWDLRFDATVAPEDAAAALRDALDDSVKHHLISDVPVGVFLSGGLDSTALLALTQRTGRRDVQALTMALPGTAEDESLLAQRTASHFGVQHQCCDVDAGFARALLADYFRAMDQPTLDGLNTLVVSRLARSRGLKVMLSGVGADELFGGYKSLHRVPQLYRWHRRAAAAGPITRGLGAAIEKLGDHRWRRVGDLLGQRPSLDHAYLAYRGIFSRAEAHRLTREFLGNAPPNDITDTTLDADLADATCRLELTRYLRNQLLRDTDVMGMSQGVEIRVPYVDARVVETAVAIARRHRLRAGKALLREAVPEIPPWIAQQPKRGFMFPIEHWLQDEWRDVFADVERRTAVATGPWFRKWCVLAFMRFLDRGPQPMSARQHPPALTGASTR